MVTYDCIPLPPDDPESLAEKIALDRWSNEGGFIPPDDGDEGQGHVSILSKSKMTRFSA